MASKGCSDSHLNDYFEAMSFQDEEEKTWQQHTDFLVSKIEDLASFFKSLPTPIDIRATGSSVEKLKIITPENLGDVDVMVMSLAEEAIISESIMEYSTIPDNPAFVRLRGKDHPVLQHCLAENSDYVASATLKDFHPKVFSQSAGFFHIIPKVFRKMQDIPSYEMVCAVQSTSGPSIQCNVSQTRGSLRDHVTGMKGYSNFKTNDEIGGFLEWMSIAMNPGKHFTDDHCALVDEASKYVEEAVQRVGKDPNIQNFGCVLGEVMMGPRVQALRTKFQELETKSAEKERNEPSETETGEVKACANHLKQEGVENMDKCTGRKQDPETGEPEDSATKTGTERFEFDDDDDENNARRSEDDFHRKKDSPNVKHVQVIKQHSGSRMQEEEAKVKAGNSTNPTEEGEETDMGKMTEQRVLQYCIENFLQVGDPSKSQEELLKEYLEIAEDQTRQKGSIDIVPAFLAKGWPTVARNWISRDRLWPNQNVISSILDYGFLLVAKTSNESDRPDLDFRLSFSHAEFVLSQELNDVQRQCYRCLKLYHSTIIRNRKPKTFATYFLKTILFWAIEETGMEFWNNENRGSCVMMLLRKLLKTLETKFLAHFFIPEFNLLGDVAKEFPEEMKFLAEEVRKVCKYPMCYPNVEENQGAEANATVEPMTDPSAVEIGPCLTTAISGRAVDANLPSKKDVSTNNQISTNLAKSKDPDSTKRVTSPFFPRFKDYQALYRQVYQEMLDLAVSDEAVDTQDPIINSIVTNMRKVMDKMETNPRKEMEVVLEHGLESTYTSYLFHTGPTPRDRILSMLKGQSEMFAYVVRQKDLAPGNEHVIVNRMLNSSSDGSSDPFDMSVLYPEGGRVLANVFEVLGAQFDPKKQSQAIDDDIPLD